MYPHSCRQYLSKIMDNLEDPLAYLPAPPDEPLPSDCCGTGCSPCVMDIYHDEMQTWTTLVAMTLPERATWRREKLGRIKGRDFAVKSALSTNAFTALTVKGIEQVTEDSFVYTISLPDGHCLGYQPGQHYVLRGVVPLTLLYCGTEANYK